jgi:GAF domain-containing protein
MNTLISALNARHWSLVTKLSVAFGFAFVFIIGLFVVAYESKVATETERQLRDYVLQTAITRRTRLESELQQTLDSLSEASQSSYLRPRLLRVIRIIGTPTGADIVSRAEATDLIRFRLIENKLFDNVRVLTLEGIVTISAQSPTIQASDLDLVGSNNSETPGYRGARDAQVLGENQRIIVYRTPNGEDRVEVVQVLAFDGEVVGYVIGRVNVQSVILNSITDRGENTPRNIVSYLATRGGNVLADLTVRPQAIASARRSPIGSALAGQTGFAQYVISNIDAPLIGHYQPLPNTALALITEAPNDIIQGSFSATVFYDNVWVVPVTLAVLAGLVFIIWRDISTPLKIAQDIAVAGIEGDLEFEIPAVTRSDILGDLTRDMVRSRSQIQDSFTALSQRLETRQRDIQATQEVGRFASNQRDLQTLMDEVVNLITNVFPNIYHAQIFLNDGANEFSVLRASTGDAGRQLLARGHRLPIGGQSVIGRTTSEGRITAVLDTDSSDVHRKNDLLPNTRAELAIPLRIGQQIIGALDVQSLSANTFTEDQIITLQSMSDQIAISLENARLYQESIKALEEIARTNRDNTAAAWREHLFGARTQEITAWDGRRTAVDSEPLRQQAIRTGITQIGGITPTRTIPIAVPIKLRGQTLGAVLWELPLVEYSDDKVALAEELVNRLAVSLDNARLFEESQRAAERERVVNDIAAKITGQTDIDSILQTAVREVGKAIGTDNVNVRLGVRNHVRGKTGPLEKPKTGPLNGTSNGHTANGTHINTSEHEGNTDDN